VFRYKVLAVAISAALTAVAGVVHAFYYNNLYPEPIFAVGRSVEIMLGPIVGGLGTLFGPILGAFVLTALGESFTALTAEIRLDGIKQLLYGLTLLAIVALRPSGLWPWLRERLGLEEERPE
jgi:branched-chain amino acid transport system permease protein